MHSIYTRLSVFKSVLKLFWYYIAIEGIADPRLIVEVHEQAVVFLGPLSVQMKPYSGNVSSSKSSDKCIMCEAFYITLRTWIALTSYPIDYH